MTSGAGAKRGANFGAPQQRRSSARSQPGGIRRGTSAGPVSGIASSQFAQRSNGGTAGLARDRTRAVFASPAARPSGKRAAAPAARSRSVTADLWSGFAPQVRSPVLAAESAAAGQPGGAPAIPLAMLGLGLAGLVGSASALALRRRKAVAPAGRRTGGDSEM